MRYKLSIVVADEDALPVKLLFLSQMELDDLLRYLNNRKNLIKE